MRHRAIVPALVVCAVAASAALGADCPRFRGPAGDGKFAEAGLLKKWPDAGPKLAWSAKGLGQGYSSAVVAGGTVYVTGQDAEGQGLLFAFGLDGSQKWKMPYGPEVGKLGPARPGSRGTPMVDGDSVFVVSGFGKLATLDAKTGKVLRTVDLLKRFGAKRARYGFAECVLIDGDRLVCTPGGKDATVAAMNKKTGETVWQSKGLSQATAYCSPRLITHGGKRIIVTVVEKAVAGIDADTGKVLWTHTHTQRFGVQPNPPVYADGVLYAASGSGGVALGLSGDGASVTEKWTDKTISSMMHGVVLVDGYVYGTGGRRGKGLACLELKSGKVMWTCPKIKSGVVVYADGMLYVYGSDGTMHLVKANPKAFEPVSSFKITQGAGMHVAHPTIANGRLYVRHGDALMAYDIKAGS